MRPTQPVRQLQNQQLEIFDRRSIRGVIAMGSTAVEKIISSAFGRSARRREFEKEIPDDGAVRFRNRTMPSFPPRGSCAVPETSTSLPQRSRFFFLHPLHLDFQPIRCGNIVGIHESRYRPFRERNGGVQSAGQSVMGQEERSNAVVFPAIVTDDGRRIVG